MDVVRTYAIGVHEPSQVGEVRRLAMRLAAEVGLDEAASGRVGLSVTEAASNLVKHATDGEICVRAFHDGEGIGGVEMLAIDKGPGIGDLASSLRDGYSTAGSPGTGLGAISRAAGTFDVFSRAAQGTVVLARFYQHQPAANTPHQPLGGVCVARTGETACGDFWTAARRQDGLRLLLADGLGHGPMAAEASERAGQIFATHPHEPLESVMDRIHVALRTTRGAAVAMADVDDRGATLRFCGVGNVSGVMLGHDTARHLVSHNGTVGHQVRRIQEFAYPWSREATLVLHSDGLSTHWSLDRYPGVIEHDPAILAGILYRDCKRSRDDATVLVARGQHGDA